MLGQKSQIEGKEIEFSARIVNETTEQCKTYPGQLNFQMNWDHPAGIA